MSLTPYERAQRYIEKAPGAVSGDAGHNQTFSIACALVNGFALPEADAWQLLSEYNQRCSPPWSEKELRHKLQSATSAHHDKPRGHLLGKSFTGAPTPARTQRPAPAVNATPTPKPAKSSYDLSTAAELPKPVEDGTRALIRALFQPGEGIRIAPAVLNDEGREIPDGGGVCLSREEWLQKLDRAQGNPNGIFSSSKKTGIYVAINPYRIGCTRDADVTEFRHALVEFDQELSPEQQYQLYTLSRLPCAAIIESGGKSVHAWVRINAKDRQEYDDRVKALYAHFESCGLPIDTKNKNPGRFSRLPNCVRFQRRQELLALNVGCESFTEWLAAVQADGIGKTATFRDMFEYDAAADGQTVLGTRWLCRGGSCLLIGPSGVGKSSLVLQLIICWALGRPAFGIVPSKALKVLVVQAENDDGDVHEMVMGVCEGLGIAFDDKAIATLEKNIVFNRNMSHTGQAFTEALRRLIDRHKPDLVVLDPLLSFIGADISRQEVCSQFLRNWLNPISEATGCVWLMVHHTGKPSHDPKAKKHWQASDYSYSGMGSSELTNWTRATVVLEQAAPGAFRLMLTKRGKRAGATHPDETPTTTIWLRHAEKGIYWEQVAPPEEPAHDDRKGGKPSKLKRLLSMDTHEFLAGCTLDGEGKNEIARRLENWLATKNEDASRGVCLKLIEELVALGKLAKKEGGRYVRGKFA